MHLDDSPKFIHAADLHLGAPLLSLSSRIPREKAENLRSLAATAFDKLVAMAIAQAVDFLVIAGDVYDSADREIASQLRFHRGLQQLHETGIRTFIVHGNHDPMVGDYRPARTFPDSVTVFRAGEVQLSHIKLRNGQSASIAGVSYQSAAEQQNLARLFRGLETRPDSPLIGVLHTNVGNSSGHGSYAPCDVADLDASDVDYWALGHIHQRRTEHLGGERWWAYSGNLQGRSAKSSECGAKGALVGSIRSNSIGRPEFVACDALRFESKLVSIDEAEGIGDVIDLVREAALESIATADGRPVLFHAELVGRTAVHAELNEQSDQILQLCREDFGNLLGDGELVRVRLSSGPLVSREQLLGRNDLLSAVLRSLDSSDKSQQGTVILIQDLVDAKALDRNAAALLIDTIGGLLPDTHDPDNTWESTDGFWEGVERVLVDSLMERP